MSTFYAHTYEKKGAVKNSVRRLIIAALAILLEIAALVSLVVELNNKFTALDYVTRALSLILVIAIFSQERSASVKMPWIVLILMLPIVGITVYLLVGLSGTTRDMRQRYDTINGELFPLLRDDQATIAALGHEDRGIANVFRYVSRSADYPVYEDSDIVFYADAAGGLEAQKEELRRAERFIFMEYHAIEDAEAFAEILDILVERQKAGVEVRVFYDDVGSIGFIDKSFARRLEALGIRCRVFNPVTPLLNVFLNNRDHRKITVVDGRVGFTGGYNLANEYFNITRPYGEWKDTGVRIRGNAVRSLTVMFLEMWNAVQSGDVDDVHYDRYLPELEAQPDGQGYIAPYGDSPLDDEHVGENVYMHIINNARDYVWFITPYLIISEEMNAALALAASRGVDVRIITPGVPDKRIAYGVTRSYYPRLAKAGVRIFEFIPGFCHAKQCVSDDTLATCGTINLDFRSLYHHFEDGVLMHGVSAVDDIKTDFEEMFARSLEVTERYRTGQSAPMGAFRHVLRLFSALM